MINVDNSRVAQINYHYLYISLDEKKENYSGGTKNDKFKKRENSRNGVFLYNIVSNERLCITGRRNSC